MKSQGLLQNSRFTAFSTVLATGLLLYLVLMIFPAGGARGLIIATNVGTVTFSALAFWTFFGVWLYINGQDISRKIWGFFTLGILLWTLAETLWAFYEVILRIETPYPSPADLFWVFGYIPLLWGLVTRHKSLNVALDPQRKIIILAVAALIFLATAYYVFWPILSEFDPARLAESLLNIFYPTIDLVLLILASLVFFSMGKGRFALTWRLILSGFMIMSVADLIFSYLSWYGLYHPDGVSNIASIIVDFGYTLSYALLALGIFAYARLLGLRRDIRLSMDYGALGRSKILLFIDPKNRIISASANFMFLAGMQDKSQYEKRFLHDILGVDENIIIHLADTLKEKGSINNHLIKIGSAGSRDVICTAVALLNPQNQYDGAGIVLQADLTGREGQEPSLTEEQKALTEAFLRRAGIHANHETQALKAYFLEQIGLIYSLVYEFNGQYVANSLLDFVAQKANEKGWDIRVKGHEISIPAEYDGEVLSTSLSQLLAASRSFGVNAVGASLVDDEMNRIDRELKPDILQVIDRYGLRIQSQTVS